jgi:uncharacterized protein (AIM24 family)
MKISARSTTSTATGFFASAGNIVWNRFTGPGKVALQSMYYHMEGGE